MASCHTLLLPAANEQHFLANEFWHGVKAVKASENRIVCVMALAIYGECVAVVIVVSLALTSFILDLRHEFN